MSPSRRRRATGLLEHPAEAFAYYRDDGVPAVVCEEKHMGSRAVVVVCRDEDAARDASASAGEGVGVVYTRTGRRFFDDAALETALLERLRAAIDASGPLGRDSTRLAVLDCELMPWSAKAQELLRGQYAAVGAAADVALHASVEALQARGVQRPRRRRAPRAHDARESAMVDAYRAAYRRYCWPVTLAGRPQAGAVSPAGQRRAGARRQGPPVAHGQRWRAVRAGSGAPRRDALPTWSTLTDTGSVGDAVRWWRS